MRRSSEGSGSSINALSAAATSPKLCGGTFVLRPTAIPEDPLTSRFGTLEGMTTGSCLCPSKLSATSTVSFSMSARICWEILANFASV